jgi:probable HAF family extracellular repeat protein
LRRFVVVLAVIGVVASAAALGVRGAGGEASAQARWTVVELDTPAGWSVATAVNSAGTVVGSRFAGGYQSCGVPFGWRQGRLENLLPSRCGGDLCVSTGALAVTPRGRVLGRTDPMCRTGGALTFWIRPAMPALEHVFGTGAPALPAPRKGQSARTCHLAADGRTVCGPYRPTYGARVLERCSSVQSSWPVGLNDRLDLIAYLDRCEDADTGDVYGPEGHVLARPGSITTFGPRSDARLAALNARGHVAGSIPVPSGGRHAFLWDGRRIVDLGTLGGRNSRATALNGDSEVAGTSATRKGAVHGFLRRNGRMTDLGPIEPIAVNARGDVLGTRREGERTLVFLWRRGRLVALGYWRSNPSYGGSEPTGLSLDDRGRVAGTDEAGHAVVWENGRRTRLPELPGAKESAALAADARAGIVGWSTNTNDVRRAVLWLPR